MWGKRSEKSVRAKMGALETVHSWAGSVEGAGTLEAGGTVIGCAGPGKLGSSWERGPCG